MPLFYFEFSEIRVSGKISSIIVITLIDLNGVVIGFHNSYNMNNGGYNEEKPSDYHFRLLLRPFISPLVRLIKIIPGGAVCRTGEETESYSFEVTSKINMAATGNDQGHETCETGVLALGISNRSR